MATQFFASINDISDDCWQRNKRACHRQHDVHKLDHIFHRMEAMKESSSKCHNEYH